MHPFTPNNRSYISTPRQTSISSPTIIRPPAITHIDIVISHILNIQTNITRIRTIHRRNNSNRRVSLIITSNINQNNRAVRIPKRIINTNIDIIHPNTQPRSIRQQPSILINNKPTTPVNRKLAHAHTGIQYINIITKPLSQSQNLISQIRIIRSSRINSKRNNRRVFVSKSIIDINNHRLQSIIPNSRSDISTTTKTNIRNPRIIGIPTRV